VVSALTLKRTKRVLLGLGVILLIGAVVLAMLMASGLMQLPEKLIAGESTVHTVARLAVVGCLLAAVGSHK
jgi:hypothetical protein